LNKGVVKVGCFLQRLIIHGTNIKMEDTYWCQIRQKYKQQYRAVTRRVGRGLTAYRPITSSHPLHRQGKTKNVVTLPPQHLFTNTTVP
jgi:hypothetical protein